MKNPRYNEDTWLPLPKSPLEGTKVQWK
jgi:serine/threonine protein kinase